MRKTTVYITDSQADRLSRLAAASGRSQAQLIREGLERVLDEGSPRVFHSMAVGRSSDRAPRGWDADGVQRKIRGKFNPRRA